LFLTESVCELIRCELNEPHKNRTVWDFFASVAHKHSKAFNSQVLHWIVKKIIFTCLLYSKRKSMSIANGGAVTFGGM